ncbi:MAG: NAD(+) synthase [Flavobacteriales bacterium]|nr:NAD(+) synthase [Flavobacteriales bacterium]
MDNKGVSEYITAWLKQYSEASGTKGFVVGVSGGIDSAVTSTLCALTGKPTTCVEMPIHQHPSQVSRASRHILDLKDRFSNVTSVEVELTESFETMKRALPRENSDDLPLANTRARLRMTTLYYIAGAKGMLVAGTGNKVEDFGVGFYTKYGDGGVDLSPIADLTKSEVYEVATYLGISQEIMEAAPTDGLFGDDRTDEDQLGASYPELEWAMKQADQQKVPSDFEGREREVLALYLRLHNANKHKMVPIPVCEIPERLRG